MSSRVNHAPPLENFTRVETFGDNQGNGNNDVHWLKVVVEPWPAAHLTRRRPPDVSTRFYRRFYQSSYRTS